MIGCDGDAGDTAEEADEVEVSENGDDECRDDCTEERAPDDEEETAFEERVEPDR